MNLLIILSAKYLYLLIIILALFFAYKYKGLSKKTIVIAILSLVFAFLIAKIAGKFFYDPRPFVTGHFKPLVPHSPNNGFPSDHALYSFLIAFVVYRVNKKSGLILGVLALIVGVSRILAGIHSIIDVLGSFVIALIAIRFVQWIIAKQNLIKL